MKISNGMIQLISKIKNNKRFFFTGLSCLAIILWYLNFQFSQNVFLYILCFAFYSFVNSCWLGLILKKNGFEKEFQFVLGFFLLLFLIAFLMAVPIVLYKITPAYLLIILLSLTVVISLKSREITKNEKKNTKILETKIVSSKSSLKVPRGFYFLGIVTFLFLFFLLFRARTGEYVDSPWKIIHPFYIYGWLVISLIIGYLIFSKCKLKTFLWVIILSSFLLHGYLSIPYQAGFGGDKWRHLGAEKWLMDGKIYEPALFGENVSYQSFGSLEIPEVFVAGNKTSYANMWGLTIALSWLTGLGIFWIDLFLGFSLFSIFLPFLILKLASLFSKKKEFLYLMIFLPFLFYPFQAYGSITMPISFAFLPFLLSLIFLGQYLKGLISGRRLFIFLFFLIPFLYFNYILYLIVFIIMLFLAWIIKNIFSDTAKQKRKKWILLSIVFILSTSILIPLLDTHNQYSSFKRPLLSSANISQVLKNFPLSLFFSVDAVFPRIYQFEQDNWLYSQTNQEFSRSVFFEIVPWWLFLTPLVWLVIIFGFTQYSKLKNKKIVLWLTLPLIIFLVNQMIASSFMEGNHIFSKRLVLLISFLTFFPLAWGLTSLTLVRRRATLGVVIIFLGLVLITTYASGPKFQVVTKDELKAAEYIWGEYQQRKEGEDSSFCVLANTWPLLALEGVSGRQIIAGGFPYYVEYRQPERVQLFANMNSSPSIRYLNKSMEITNSQECYFATEERWIFFDRRQEIIESLDKMLGDHQQIGKVMIWLYTL
ncbi:MAG: hypothetical protein Q7J06_04010 [Bacteroidales bacterium]|nr:hypothetical protein [Bacteroidales bacterium]